MTQHAHMGRLLLFSLFCFTLSRRSIHEMDDFDSESGYEGGRGVGLGSADSFRISNIVPILSYISQKYRLAHERYSISALQRLTREY